MNSKQITEALRKEYPHATIVIGKDEHPDNDYIAALIEPTVNHAHYSATVMVLGHQALHRHKTTAEIVIVLKGIVEVVIGGQSKMVTEGAFKILQPGEAHELSAGGKDSVWVALYAEPGMTSEDTIYGTETGAVQPATEPPSIESLMEFFADKHIAVRQSSGNTIVLDTGDGKVFTLSIT
ncbi:hypothetical protein COU89_00520 [Candidatus Roizmanbacteria bacterium CG10_big_fil_rev_8_21_14_0_10_45_7]|uniref:Cupin type-2 domain-containing protein n=1 Tax=Candidatus Roizmanbacteria bacterium CG10_big_fil_rev_8_21_14_0_10_45_7 TaxID=1974854 RepID=A0A2M8KVL2_9BACT|nr:MAG: hypothetical protein COU89_00520 [Candidatus Roizmanbacteria bacterium CG10_big_fil_rev_8_21_14_0_10_45_7]